MNYIELINWFWELDEKWQFSCCETRLYFYLVKTANSLGWEDNWKHSDAKTAANVGVSLNKMKPARNRLSQAGLISFDSGGRGYGDKCRYQILTPNYSPKSIPKSIPKSVPKSAPTPYIDKQKLKGPPVYPPEKKDLQLSLIATEKETAITEEVVKFYNLTCTGMKPVKLITKKRVGLIRARLTDHGKAAVFEMFRKAAASAFLNGQGAKGWIADFDWLLRPENFVKVYEGKYNGIQKQYNDAGPVNDRLQVGQNYDPGF